MSLQAKRISRDGIGVTNHAIRLPGGVQDKTRIQAWIAQVVPWYLCGRLGVSWDLKMNDEYDISACNDITAIVCRSMRCLGFKPRLKVE